MKIIFLDIDGVLNHRAWFENFNSTSSDNLYIRMIDPDKVNLLKKIISETGAVIVLSSTWRHMRDIRDILGHFDIEIVGITPDLERDVEWDTRGREIDAWLNKKAKTLPKEETIQFVILDDDDDMLESQKDHFCHIDRDVGLTEKDVDEAITILEREV